MSRNEPARERRRRLLKQNSSLTSLPLDSNKRLKLTLENHFGWTTLQKCWVGDGTLVKPQVVQYYEYPIKNTPDYQKVTHIMYLDENPGLGKGKGGGKGNKLDKQLQTSWSATMSNKPPEIIELPPLEEPPVEQLDPANYVGVILRGTEERIREERKEKKDKKEKKEKKKKSSDSGDGEHVKEEKGQKKKKGEKSRTKPKSWQVKAH